MDKDWKFEALYQELCSYFNFDAVYDTMLTLNWTWGGDNPPDVYEMRDVVRRLFKDIYYKDISEVGTGGFKIIKKIDDEGATYTLEFIVESSSIETGGDNG